MARRPLAAVASDAPVDAGNGLKPGHQAGVGTDGEGPKPVSEHLGSADPGVTLRIYEVPLSLTTTNEWLAGKHRRWGMTAGTCTTPPKNLSTSTN